MGERASAFGDHGDGAVEKRGPCGVGRSGDEHGMLREMGEVLGLIDKKDGPFHHSRTTCQSGKEAAAFFDIDRRCVRRPFRLPEGGLPIAGLLLPDGNRKISPAFGTVAPDGLVQLPAPGEEDVHRLVQNLPLDQFPAERPQAPPEDGCQPHGLVVFEVIQFGVGSGEVDELAEKELEIPGKVLHERGFRLQRRSLEACPPGGGVSGTGGAKHQFHVVENHPGSLDPGGDVGIEVDLPVPVIPQEAGETVEKVVERIQQGLGNDGSCLLGF